MESKFPLLVLNKKRNLMIRNSLTALIVSFILTLAIVSCGKKNQHYIEKIIEKIRFKNSFFKEPLFSKAFPSNMTPSSPNLLSKNQIFSMLEGCEKKKKGRKRK